MMKVVKTHDTSPDKPDIPVTSKSKVNTDSKPLANGLGDVLREMGEIPEVVETSGIF